MAGDWIKLEHATPGKPEIYRLSRMLGVSRGDAFLLAVEWWVWLDQNSCNGHVTLLLRQDIDKIVHCDGFATAMEAVGWLKFDAEDRCAVTNFDRHNGKTAKNRALTKDRMKRSRYAKSDDVVTQKASPEKRREENKNTTSTANALDMPAGFNEFWSTWPASPRKTAKAKCAEVWKRRGLHAIAEQVVAHVVTLKASDQWARGFEPAPLTYLNQGRWHDADDAVVEGRKWD